MRHGATVLRMRELTEVIGVDRRTVERWRTWWRDSFTATRSSRKAFLKCMQADGYNMLNSQPQTADAGRGSLG
jgi:hypothetical protein